MSRIGKALIVLPPGVEVRATDSGVEVKGPKGKLQKAMAGVILSIDQNKVMVQIDQKKFMNSKFHGLYRALLNNMVLGVSKGFEKRLELVGVGYRAAVTGKELEIKVGFTPRTSIPIPQGIQVTVEKNVEIIITGIDKQLVGQLAADIRSLKKPEPYKGKGIRYKGEIVRKKAGKAAIKAKV